MYCPVCSAHSLAVCVSICSVYFLCCAVRQCVLSAQLTAAAEPSLLLVVAQCLLLVWLCVLLFYVCACCSVLLLLPCLLCVLWPPGAVLVVSNLCAQCGCVLSSVWTLPLLYGCGCCPVSVLWLRALSGMVVRIVYAAQYSCVHSLVWLCALCSG